MNFTDYINNKTIVQINEQYGTPPDQETQPPAIEFEEIKKYLLFGKLKQMKKKFETADLDQSDKKIQQLHEFFNLLIVFYNTLSYTDIMTLINRLIQTLVDVANIKIVDEFQAEPEQEPEQEPQVSQVPGVEHSA